MMRAEAKALGLKFYNTGKPCKRGHLSDRYVRGAACVECVKSQASAWKCSNSDKHKHAVRNWWENNKETHNQRCRNWQSANPEKVKAAAKLWRAANPEKVANKYKRYRQRHPDKVAARAAASAASRSKRVPNWLTPDDKWLLGEAYSLAKLRTKMFGFVWEVDHIVPLRGVAVSGLHVPANVQVIPKTLNRLKRNQFSLA